MGSTYDISYETVDHDGRHALADDDSENLDVLHVGRELVVGNDPALRAEQRLHPLLLDFRVLRAVWLGKAK